MHLAASGPWWDELSATAELALVVLRADGVIEHVNPFLAGLVGQPAASLVGRSFVDALVVDAHRERAASFFLGGEQAVPTEPIIIPLNAMNGARVEIRWTRVRCDLGPVKRFHAASGIDLTLQMRQEAEIERSGAMVFSYLQASPEAVVITDASGVIVVFSDGAEKVFRCKREGMAGKPISDLMPARFRAAHAALADGFIRSGAPSRKMGERTEIRALRYTGEEFAAEATIARLDLIIFDASSPAFAACDFVQALRRDAHGRNRHAPVLVITAYTQFSRINIARDSGANFVIAKPLTPMMFLQRIQWLSRDRRGYVDCATYAGPDRRFKFQGPPPGTDGRRAGDLKGELGIATEPNMSQADIDALMQPTRFVL